MIQFYKPNKSVTGNACSFWLNRDGSIMSSMIKQDSWNQERRVGSFSKNKGNPQKSVITKLSRIEVGGIIDAIETNREFSAYHRSQKQILQIRFCPYIRDDKQIGFSFSINKQDVEDSTNKVSFVIGFYFPESRLLKHDLETFLDKTIKIQHYIPEESNELAPKSPVKEHNLDSPPSSDPFEDSEIF